MTTRLYRSIDGGAPSLTGTAGSGIALLDAVLINGYNSKTVTITRSGATATATCVGHGFPNDGVTKVLISGADQAEYNVETYITNVTANTFDYTVTGSPATPATGTITAKVPGAGWSKAFTGTNLAAYKNSTSTIGTIHQRCLRVNDTNAQYMVVSGYESMTDVNTGLGPMPSPSDQNVSGGTYWMKSNTANATVRNWCVIASEKFFIFWHDAYGTNYYAPALGANGYYYGDFTPTWSTDQYATTLSGGAGTATNTNGVLYAMFALSATTNSPTIFLQRRASGIGGAILSAKSSLAAATALSQLGANASSYGFENYMTFGHVYAQENAPTGFIVRGKIPGIKDPLSIYTMWSNGDIIIPQSGNAAGRKFINLRLTNNGTNTLVSNVMIDFSDSWDT